MIQLFMILVCFLSIFLFKSRLIQLALLFFIYPILIVSILANGFYPTRIISNVGDAYYHDLYEIGFYIQVMSYTFFVLALFSLRKRTFSIIALPMKDNIRIFFLIFLFLVYPIAYPAIFGLGDSRFGSGGSLVILFNAVILLSRGSKLNLIDYLAFLINAFAFISGERADIILFLFLTLMLQYKDGYILERKLSSVKIFTILIFIYLFGTVSGVVRSGEDIQILTILNNILNQGTAVDVVHVFLSSLWYFNKLGNDLSPIINIISSFIPFTPTGGASSSLNVTEILRSEIYNVGGGLFYSSGVLALGYFGAPLVAYLYGRVIKFFFLSRGYYSLIFIAIFIQQLRIQWYGINYLGNVISFGLIIILLIHLLLNLKKSTY